MIELNHDELFFSFPEVHPKAILRIEFMRTLRIPDDDKTYFLPPGLGKFPLRHVDDFQDRVPSTWLEHGGVMLPMYQAEALWLLFDSGRTWRFRHAEHFPSPYPFLIRIGTGKINAVTGKPWTDQVSRDPQDYVVAPEQPWLDGYCVEKGTIRQFVAMPLGQGYSVEEQITGKAEHGGLQIVAYPIKREAYEERRRSVREQVVCMYQVSDEMGLAPGGRMKQKIYEDPYQFEDWDLDHRSRCFVHIANPIAWKAITGRYPRIAPPSAEKYNKHGLPWFDYYDTDIKALDGAKALQGMKSIVETSVEKAETVLLENESFETKNVVMLEGVKNKSIVREGKF